MMFSFSRNRNSVSAFIAVFLILGIFPGTIYFYSKYKDYQNEQKLYIANQLEVMDYFQTEVKSKFLNVFNDLLYLGLSCSFTHYLELGTDISLVKENWILFAGTSRSYDQIRYLDKRGMEIIRINYNNGNPSAVPDEDLQNKKNRYYYSMLQEFDEPTIVVSPIDLNIEHSEIEIPLKPIIRFSLPIYDEVGEFNGVVILNYFAETLFKNVKNRFSTEQSIVYVMNQDDYIISGPDPEYLWGFMFEEKRDYTFTKLFGHILKDGGQETENVFFNKEGLVVQGIVYPESDIISRFLNDFLPDYNVYFMDDWWKIVSLGEKNSNILFNRKLMFSLVGALWKVELFFLIISLGLSYFISTLYVRKNSAEKMRDTLKSVMHEVVNALELTSTMNDDDTGNHIRRVCRYTEALATEYGVKKNRIEVISEMASLHDIGKVGVPDSILKKKGPLSQEEWEEMKTHVFVGHKIVNQLHIDPIARNIVLFHHENWDGTGYMNQLKESDIPIEARLVSLADVYDALRTKRSYKEALSHETSCEIIINEKGKKFDPYVVDCFEKIEQEFLLISEELDDNKNY